jgi:hypothetical protein
MYKHNAIRIKINSNTAEEGVINQDVKKRLPFITNII